jgi:hypothetical protein
MACRMMYGYVSNAFRYQRKFHVDNLSSAHVYLRLPEEMTWETIPQEILIDCAQLTKANSIEGNIPNFILVTENQVTKRIISQ